MSYFLITKKLYITQDCFTFTVTHNSNLPKHFDIPPVVTQIYAKQVIRSSTVNTRLYCAIKNLWPSVSACTRSRRRALARDFDNVTAVRSIDRVASPSRLFRGQKKSTGEAPTAARVNPLFAEAASASTFLFLSGFLLRSSANKATTFFEIICRAFSGS